MLELLFTVNTYAMRVEGEGGGGRTPSLFLLERVNACCARKVIRLRDVPSKTFDEQMVKTLPVRENHNLLFAS